MTTTAPTLPPPLSAPPSTATLQGLLDALQQPMQRGVPTPPTPDRVFEEGPPARPSAIRQEADPSTIRGDGAALDLTRLEQLVASRHAIESPSRGEAAASDGVPAPPDAPEPVAPGLVPPAAVPPTPALSWSAGRVHHHRRTAAIAAVAAAAGAAAALVAAGELVLP